MTMCIWNYKVTLGAYTLIMAANVNSDKSETTLITR
jgi:hypothetical protein